MATGSKQTMKNILLTIALLLLAPVSQATECPRIISQSPYITRSLQWLGLEECIVGVSRYDHLALPHTGGISKPDKQAIDDLMPDIIFTSDRTKAEILKQVTPKGTQSFRLSGFNSMQQVENNLRIIGKAAGIRDIESRVASFHLDWRKAISRIDAKAKKALLISSCSKMPYSFGKNTWLYDLFQQAGFRLVETHERIRHIKKGQEIEEINGLLNRFEPELLFIFERTLNQQCNLLLPKTPIQIVTLDGKLFLHPAPILLEGLAELEQKQGQWH